MSPILVSVRNAAEAELVCQYPVSIVDLKEPRNGALGRPGQQTAESVADIVGNGYQTSIALGEIHELNGPLLNRLAPTLARFEYAKIGLSGQAAQLTQLLTRWRRTVAAIPASTCVVPVAYADWHRCDAPSPERVLQLSIETKANTILVDTYDKRLGRLFDAMSPESICEFTKSANDHGIRVVLAGSIDLENLQLALACRPHWIGVRGAVCKQQQRDATIDPTRLERFVKAVQESIRITAAYHHK